MCDWEEMENFTMGWERVRPLVQGGIELGDDTLLPLLVAVAQLRSRLVRCVLKRTELFNVKIFH